MDGSPGTLERGKRDQLIEEYQGYVQGTVRKLVRYMGLPANKYDDFVSAGYLGLVEAAGRYDPSCNDSFENYAYLRIRGAVIDSIRDDSDIKGTAYKRAQALAAAHEIRMEVYNRANGSKDPRALKVTSSQSADGNLEQILDLAAKTALTHRLTFTDAESEINELSAASATPEQLLQGKQEKLQLHKILATLPAKERLIIENFYFKDMSFTDIAQKHAGLSKSWISRLHDKGLELLKKQLLKPRRARIDVPVSTSVVSIKKTRRGRPAATERRLSGANPDKSLRKRSKSRPRTVRGGRLLSNQDAPV